MQRYDEDEIEHIYLDDEDEIPRQDTMQHGLTPAIESQEAYKKMWYVVVGIVWVAALLTFVRGISLDRFMADFMAVFFITFASFKFIDIERFAHAYRSFDIIANRVRPWAYVFPFVEAFLGFWYLLSEAPQNLNILALAVTGSALIGAFRESKRKSRFKYAAMRTFIRLPLARVSFIENATMFLLALATFLLKV